MPLRTPWEAVETDSVATALPDPDFPEFSIQELLERGILLLSSAGHEYTKPVGILRNPAEVKRARKAAMSRLGLDFLDSIDGDSMDIDKELAPEEDQDDVEMKVESTDIVKPEPTEQRVFPKISVDTNVASSSSSLTKVESALSPSPVTPTPATAVENMAGLSARERNRLKRKRKPGNTAFIAAPPPSAGGSRFQAQSAGPGHK